MKLIKQYIFLFFLFVIVQQARSQGTGLVLSGGGASGLAHIGVIKALEENHIPIDYITGTSIGAFVGAMYAAGYSPYEMEALVNAENFRNLAYGNVDPKFIYYFKKKDDNASWIKFKFSLDSSLITTIPTNLISPLPMDFGLMQMLSSTSAAASYNFDSLFIPFRCVASDIESESQVIFKNGDLGESVRASMSYPFYLKPITVNGKLLFDGGLYNNFPADVMQVNFHPDYIIGSNVTTNAPPPNDENILSQLRSMLVSKTNYDLTGNGIVIKPSTNVALFAFENVQALIDSGYVATLRDIDKIKEAVKARRTASDLNKLRENFKQKKVPVIFDQIYIEGLNSKQAQYVKKLLRHKERYISLEKMTPQYFRLAADDKIKSIYPKATFNKSTGYYDLYLKIKKEKDMITYFGGNFSNRPINTGFVGAQYNYLGQLAVSLSANTYFGKLYSSAQVKSRFDFPTALPFYVEPQLTFNRWDFFKSSTSFFEDVKPSYLIQRENYGQIDVGAPVKIKGRLILGAALGLINHRYYQTEQFLQADTADRTEFSFFTSHIEYNLNSLNRKQYANEGVFFMAKLRYVQGEEFNEPGSTSPDITKIRRIHEWPQLKVVYDNYYKQRGTLRLGVYFEGVYSAQTLFNNYTASVLAAPAFQPVPESKTFFLENLRAHKYLAGGIKNIIAFKRGFEFRLEGYVFVPYQAILKSADLTAEYGNPFSSKSYIATSAVVYQTPVGPICLSLNYYSNKEKPLSLLFHFGYLIFNRQALD